jgi:hypothetical protein
MADIDLKTLSPDATINDSAVLFGADSQSAGSPSVYSAETVKNYAIEGVRVSAIGYVIDGGGAAIATGVAGLGIRVPFACTIIEWTLQADQTGDIVIDIWKDTYANYPPTVADTITASAKPTISASNKASSSTLTGWDASVAAGDMLFFNVDSCVDITQVVLTLKVSKA